MLLFIKEVFSDDRLPAYISGDIMKRIDKSIFLVPFISILALCALFIAFPEGSTSVLASIRAFTDHYLGSYYCLIGLGLFLVSIYMACSRYGNIRLGGDKPEYSNFKWGTMMFTTGLAADIVFYSFCEWMLYAEDPYVASLGSIQDWASTYPLFHWGPIPWGFYLVLAVAFGFMLHVRNCRKQRYSEACRPILGAKTDGPIGRIIDLIAVFALVAGTATTFALATPLLSMAVSKVLGIPDTITLTIVLLLVTCLVYSLCTAMGIQAIAKLAGICTYLFFALLAYVFIFGGEGLYIVETGIAAIGNLVQNFFGMATRTDPLRLTSFPQNWTFFYWAYWMVWCVAAPFFIGSISRGRTVRQVIIGGYTFGIGGTFLSFTILGNYSLGLQMHGKLDLLADYAASGSLYETIIEVIRTLPLSTVVLVLLALTLIAFYATSFDSLSTIAAVYSYKDLGADEEPGQKIRLLWAVLLILLPIALIFSENSMNNLQTVSMLAAIPVGFIMLLIVASFFKDADRYLKGDK